ncbi:MerR family transcriptional regulator [Clostridium estertheticum]|uniref:MerR family transcriptional regulator n=1 Tax=Clostridium estertheticum TaxID=238834 RepID=UPI001C0AFAEC|nr:MerR family transcriptional regulator [Clostridium estertheticum]MBU3178353.1 MerR family transcriptional regulator [Clostridium estertheticum]MCB2354560.1 MerR family transcriptional regulator [Clostridium estertheticum]MCB2358487.1 MerR family transcriptional regulator [Clostridium estertheticum]WAG40810.1 MerR family transcriptional regulator [Clostridium estertheticum]
MTITQVSKRFDLSQDTLRYYERIGLIPQVNRTKSGIRDYTEESCKWIELAKCMRLAGVPIEALIEYCVLTQQGDLTVTARKELLVEERRKLMEKMGNMAKTLDRLNYKIDRYEKAEVTGILSWDK